MAGKRKKQSPKKQTPVDQARALWLAGLGAASIARKRGGELVAELIAEGHELQSRAQKLAQQMTSQATEQAKDALAPFEVEFKRNIKKLSEVVQNGVAGALAVFGIPSKSDVEALSQRVAALSKQLKTAR